ncbi:hypothetical protein [Pseudoflavonifractor phocaeensis]|uniref:hypothetical protein n=1 Tax=Pseudoflavonifractor phocaeensis TaxID=1870988 RepID=UPI0030845A21
MRRLKTGKGWTAGDGRLTALAVLSLCFLGGGLLGVLSAAGAEEEAAAGLASYLSAFLATAQAGTLSVPGLPAQVWSVIRWPLLVLLLGFSAVGLVGIPAVFGVRGFLLGFSIGSFVRFYGGAGGLLAALVFGVSGCVAVPVLFVLGVQSLLAARTLALRMVEERRRLLPYGRRYWLCCGVCAGGLAVCVLLEWAAVPSLVMGAARLLRLS